MDPLLLLPGHKLPGVRIALIIGRLSAPELLVFIIGRPGQAAIIQVLPMDWDTTLWNMNEVAEQLWRVASTPGVVARDRLNYIHALVTQYDHGDRSQDLYDHMRETLTEDWWFGRRKVREYIHDGE